MQFFADPVFRDDFQILLQILFQISNNFQNRGVEFMALEISRCENFWNLIKGA